MNAPDRSAAVASLVAANRQIFAVERHDEHRRAFLPTICALLNHVEEVNGNPPAWGVLVKRDRTPAHIPPDVIVWRDTGEHFDVLTGTGPAWIALGPIGSRSSRWDWAPASVVAPTGASTPIEPAPAPAPDLAPLVDARDEPERFVAVLEEFVAAIVGLAEALRDHAREVKRANDDGVRIHL